MYLLFSGSVVSETSLFLSSVSFYFLLVFSKNQLSIWLILFFVSLIFTFIYYYIFYVLMSKNIYHI